MEHAISRLKFWIAREEYFLTDSYGLQNRRTFLTLSAKCESRAMGRNLCSPRACFCLPKKGKNYTCSAGKPTVHE